MLELIVYIFCLLLAVVPLGYVLGIYISSQFKNTEDKDSKLKSFFNKIEQPIYKFCNIDPEESMRPKRYFMILFSSNVILFIFAFIILYLQHLLPFQGNTNYKLDILLITHSLVSLITNTCQSHHIGEQHFTYLSNFFVVPLLMFYSSATGLATGIAVMRGITLGTLGNAYSDIIKSLVRVLIPISLLISLIFTFLGMPNTFQSSISYTTLEHIKENLILGPVAAFEAIKLFGDNGFSCFTANSAHPFENPSYLSNFLENISILVFPIGLLFTLGLWLKNKKQAAIIQIALLSVLVFEYAVVTTFELSGNHKINNALSVSEPNWTGKETRIGIVGSSIFLATTSNASGAQNANLESFNPIINIFGLFNITNQSIFGVLGFGLVYTINFILYTTFFLGLMIGKTPELFGKRIEKNEIILSSFLLLLNPILIFSGIILTILITPETSSSFLTQVHQYTRIFYEFASASAGNGSGMEGLIDNSNYWNGILSVILFVGRYCGMGIMLALGYSFARKPSIPKSIATFRTDTFLFGAIFLFMSIIATTLIYFPFITLGPLAEYLLLR